MYDSSASSSAFSFIDGEEMEGVEEEGVERGVDPVTVRRPSDGDVVMMDESASFVNGQSNVSSTFLSPRLFYSSY